MKSKKVFGRIPYCRKLGAPASCACDVDSSASATGFSKPAASVEAAIAQGLISDGMAYLEIGAGNLRNALHTQKKLRLKSCNAVESESVVRRFGEEYALFAKGG